MATISLHLTKGKANLVQESGQAMILAAKSDNSQAKTKTPGRL